jgi:hypothetical protein
VSITHIQLRLARQSSVASAIRRPGRHCLRTAEKLQVPCEVLEVSVTEIADFGVEASARKARYTAFKNALRGAGVADRTSCRRPAGNDSTGIDARFGCRWSAAMPARVRFGAGWHARPLLGFTHESLRDWAVARSCNISTTQATPIPTSIATSCAAKW